MDFIETRVLDMGRYYDLNVYPLASVREAVDEAMKAENER